MPCNPDSTIFMLCTDANTKYTANATQVGAECSYHGGGISDGKGGIVAPTWDYSMGLERWDSGRGLWMPEGWTSGYFKTRTPMKYFSIVGKPAGTYRVRMVYEARENPSYSGYVTTYSFLVER